MAKKKKEPKYAYCKACDTTVEVDENDRCVKCTSVAEPLKKINVHYSFYLSDSIEVEAKDEKEAVDIVEQMIECCELGNLNEMDIGDSRVWVD